MKFEKTIKRVKKRKAGIMITIMFLLLMPFSSSAQDFSGGSFGGGSFGGGGSGGGW